MPEINRIWRIAENQLKELRRTPTTEKDLEIWIEKDISIISPNLLLIGRQVTTDSGAIDLLAIDRNGDAVIIQFKRGRKPKEVVAQLLDYAAWLSSLNPERIKEIAENYLKRSLEEVFTEKFGAKLPELNRSQKMLLVATEADDSTEEVVRYLSETYDVNVNVVNFESFENENGNQFLLRTFVLHPSQASFGREEFLSTCNDKERLFFKRLFEMAGSLNLGFSWGANYCTIQVPANCEGIFIIPFWCFSRIGPHDAAFTISLREIKSKVKDQNIDEIKAKFRETNLFKELGDVELRLDFSKDLTENDVEKIMSLLEELVSEILGCK